MSITLQILTGPTATDKTEIGFNIAREIEGEIVSADSMLFYRGMNIGTAKPSLSMRKIVSHHLIDIIYPWESYSVGKYVRDAEEVISNLFKKKRKFLITGGSPLYIKGIINGIFNGPEADWSIREKLKRIANKKGSSFVHGILQKVDPVKAKELHPNDLRRVIRAIEIYKKTGRQVSVLQEQYRKTRKNYKFKIICLTREKEDLYRRIDKRVETMFEKGLVDEVQSLLDNPKGLSRQAKQALGYKEVICYLEGECTLSETKEMIKLNTRKFSKRQMTWFRSFPGIHWLEIKGHEESKEISEKIVLMLNAHATT
ncbi:MAG: tRNA delta(2)-isopentenylpyrophosphate transferase [Candidatus Scalindua rubra]|uniref:tRNA dimethylallyltransferase n=1 Tax=Candidatus Scalindua rubra TaxID=1872076 RepID=A0A1E3XDC7_9BACT|nr:MAG: tRNA delta(2)-isopentenylpyrophosphate transferase [Candidatus Scalindua rubra]